jgi:tetratricopeptide (TPR) repeat protein
MKRNTRTGILPVLALLCVVSVATSESAEAQEQFQKANAEFAAGDFKRAAADYDAIVRSGEWSANLFYNLGNAHFRNGDLGRAVLNYERALQLEREHPEAEANLHIAREQARALEFTSGPTERYLRLADAGTYTITCAVLFWLAVLLLIWRAQRAVLAGAALLFAFALGCGFAAHAQEKWMDELAIVTGDNVEARVATADTAKSVLALPPGSEVRFLQRRGDWSYAALPNDQRGWIAASAAERVRL